MDRSSAQERVPTIDDLRVKLCYICREEESYDDPADPPRLWTHPCKCTLVAHESCLLHWIKTQQQDHGRARNALKCPQCGDRYEIVSENPPALQILDFVNRALSRFGRVVTACCFGTLVLSCGAGVYFVCTSYGAFALREFLGEEMYAVLLTDDPKRWPWHAFINLPLIPLGLIASRTSFVTGMSPLLPLLFAWPTSVPVSPHVNFNPPTHAALWPPPPALICALFPVVRALYNRLRARVTHAVMRTVPQPPPPPPPAGQANRFELRINAHLLVERAGRDPAPAPAAVPGEPGPPQAPIEADQQPQGHGHAHIEVEHDGPGPGQAPIEEDAAAAAARTIRVTGASIGRIVGGALVLPSVARVMGAALLRLSHVMPLVRALIAPRPPLTRGRGIVGLWGASVAQQSGFGGHLMALTRLLLTGSSTWVASDPVWWRNALGLGLFLVAKDGVKILHLWLAKQELESRHVKSKTFAGVDLAGLDLID
ncbi:hypothetical protein BC834DRAFT_922489 [Gloeopeniophorella convolvens]|nr:hypothetical protein BC834DRAFT_922489 [Gloeopeniophorella convolvens]